jgi:hypothetical protein
MLDHFFPVLDRYAAVHVRAFTLAIAVPLSVTNRLLALACPVPSTLHALPVRVFVARISGPESSKICSFSGAVHHDALPRSELRLQHVVTRCTALPTTAIVVCAMEARPQPLTSTEGFWEASSYELITDTIGL